MLRMFAVTCILFFFAACDNKYTPPEGWLKHENYSLKFTLYYPSDWKLSNTPANPELVFYISSPKQGEHDHIQENVNFISQIVDPNIDLTTYINALETKANGQLEEIEKLSSSDTTYKSFPAIHSVYVAKVNDIRVKWEQYAWKKDNRTFILTYSADISQFDIYKGLGHEIMESIEFY